MPKGSPINDFQPSSDKKKMPDIPHAFLSPFGSKFRVLDDVQTTNGNEIVNGDNRHPADPDGANNFEIVNVENAVLNTSSSEEDNFYYHVKTLKTEFYEKANGDVVVRVQPKPASPDSLKVKFSENEFELIFRTKDKKFLTTHEGTTEDTRFRWTCYLYDTVEPEHCHVRVQNLAEITLRKADPTKKWTSLSMVRPPITSSITAKSKHLNTLSTTPPTSDLIPTSSSTIAKPSCKVPPYHELGHVVAPGFTGLRNFGNTCFMNASLQALINTRELRDYFLDGHYARDISRTNPLGFQGRLAEAFAQFVVDMWSGMNRLFEPHLLKELVGLKASQFANFAQQDAQEFLSFLLDGLHEDLNRVGHNKPLTPTVECDGRHDAVVADEAWRYHRMRNNSFIVDLFHGQLKSHLACPTCGNTSITFDPFIYLPVPFPKSRRPFTFYFWSIDPYAKPVKYTLSLVEDDSRVGDVYARLSEMINVKPWQLRMIEVFRQKVFRRFTADDRLSFVRTSDIIYIFQMHDPKEVGEEVVELTVIQRQLHPRVPFSNHCSACGKQSQDLRTCTKCKTASYCNVHCQKTDWQYHRIRCRPPSPELVGYPFVISIPASKVTCRHLIELLEARAWLTVDVFQAFEDGTNDLDHPTVPYPSGTAPPDAFGTHQLKRSRVVFGEPHQQHHSWPLFQLAFTTDEGEYVLVDGKEKRLVCADKDRPLNLEKDACIAMDWINKNSSKTEHLVVLTKDEVDYVQDAACNQCANTDGVLQLSDLFERFSETETLSAEDAWYCGRCQEHRQAKKTMQLWRLPSVLIVQMKRFVYTSNIFRNKIDKHVEYPLRGFNVRPYMAASCGENENTIYDLYAVVCHSGTPFFGHYIAYARLPRLTDSTKSEIEWRCFDDSNVNRVQAEDQVVDADAYFLFYKRRDNAAAEILEEPKSNGTVENE